MANVVIFGVKDFAELAWYYLSNDSPHKVVAFAVHEAYLPQSKDFHGLPVLPFEQIEVSYPPGEFHFFAPMSPKGMNKPRAAVYHEIRNKGYELISYVSSKATSFAEQIGDNCFILEDNTLQPFTKIGSNVVLWNGNHICHHSVVRDHVSFASHVVLSGHCLAEPYCFFGVNSAIRDGLTVAEGSLIGMSASLTKSTEPWSVYLGNPAKILEGRSSLSMM